MPVRTIDKCYDERRADKAKTLSKSTGNVNQALGLNNVTSRLSGPDLSDAKHFSDKNVANRNFMDRYKEKQPNGHEMLTLQL